MSETIYKVGQILENSMRQFTKVISVKNGIYGISGWMALEHAKKSVVATNFVNIYGLTYANARVVGGGKSAKPAPAAAGSDTTATKDKPTKSQLSKLNAESRRALAEKLGLSTEGTSAEVLERLCSHYEL